MSTPQEPTIDKTYIRLSLYDFDGTIYNGDSLIDFWKYTVNKKMLGLIFVPYQFFNAVLYIMRLISAESLKKNLLIQVLLFDNDGLRKHIESFWKVHEVKINPWVRDFLKEDKRNKLTTICISASPSFILRPISELLSFDVLIATDFLIENGKQTNRLFTPNCKSKEKVARLKNWAENTGKTFVVEKVYTDSEDDAPLYCMAKQSYWVKNGVLSQRRRAA